MYNYFEKHDDPRAYEDYAYAEPKHCCNTCTDKEDQLQEASYLLEKLLKMVYGKYDALNFENTLDDLCYSLHISPREGEMQIVSKDTLTFQPKPS